MMKKLLQITCLCLSVSFVNAQEKEWNGINGASWAYNLDATRGESFADSYVAEKVKDINGFKDGELSIGTTPTITTTALGWFPAPSSEGDPTTVQVRAAIATQARYTLIKDGEDIKSLKIDATNALNKFIIRSIDNTKATAIAKYSFNLKTHYKDGNGDAVTPAAARDYYLIFGHNDGATATNVLGSIFRDGNHSNTQTTYTRQAIFTGFKLSYVASQQGLSFTHRKVLTPGTGTDNTNNVNGTLAYNPITVSINADGTDSDWEIYCNNSSNAQYYVIDNDIYAVQPQTFHLFINGNKIGEYDIANSGVVTIDAGKALNSFMVYTTGTTAQVDELGYGSIELSDFKVDYVSTTSDIPLPVSLASFTGNYDGNSIKLNWKTLSEKDNSHFEVLRSGDGITFNEITRVQGQGNSAEAVNYTATDYTPLEGTNYYMLKQVDNNGNYALSDIIAVNTSLADNTLKVVKKGGALGITLYSANSSIINVYVTDVNGRKLYSQRVQVSAGNNQFEVVIPSLSAGVYVLSSESETGRQSVKFVN